MNKALIVLLGLLLLAILGYFCIYERSTIIQIDIDTRLHASLAELGIDDIDIVTDGRDIVLTGEVASDKIKQKAEQHAKQVYGVHTVDNQLTIASIEEPVTELEPVSDTDTAKKEIDAEILKPKLEPLPEYTCQQDFDVLLNLNKINFATNSADIDPSSHALLNDLTDIANQCSEAKIEIRGHTDASGDDDYNLLLSQARATAVMDHLINNGVEASRLSAIGYGETKPIADNETDAGKAKNRRIEFNVEGL